MRFEPAVSEKSGADRGLEQIDGFGSEARRLLRETADVKARLAKRPGHGAAARMRLRELAGEARDLRSRVRRQVPDAPEATSIIAAAELIERGAEQLLAFARSGRDDWLMTARDALNEAEQRLDGVGDRLGDDGRESG